MKNADRAVQRLTYLAIYYETYFDDAVRCGGPRNSLRSIGTVADDAEYEPQYFIRNGIIFRYQLTYCGGSSTSVSVSGTANVSFVAGTQITLLPGFTVAAASGSAFQASIAPVQTFTFQTSPSGLLIAIDGITNPAPLTFQWHAGSIHTIGVTTAPQAGASGTSTFARTGPIAAASRIP